MTASTTTASKIPASSRWRTGAKLFYVLVILILVYFFYKEFFDSGAFGNLRWWRLGTVCLLSGSLFYVLVLLDSDYRGFGLYIYLNFFLAIMISSFVQDQLVSNREIVRTIQNNAVLNFLCGGYFESVVCSLVLGLLTALALTSLAIIIVAYPAALYILALHEMEGVSRRDAMRYVIALILGLNLSYMLVENGQALITKEAGKLWMIGGPGKLIVKQGNIVVLERGGKITRVVSAGVSSLKPLEGIRNIFVLGPQTRFADIEHILTKDRIPLKIRLAIKVQIEPAAEADKRPESHIAPNGEALTKKLDDGLYQVYEGTVTKAALTSQAISFAKRYIDKCEEHKCQDVEESTWLKAAASLPEAELRDHIMSHRFDELFELVDSAPGEKPEIRVNKRKIYEIEQAILTQIRATRTGVLGVMVRAVDIGRIDFPEGAEQLLLNRWGAPWQQQIHLLESEGKAQSELRARVLGAQGKLEATRLEAQGEWEIADLKAQAVLVKARAQARKRQVEGRGEAAARAAFFECIIEALQVDGRPLDRKLTGAILLRLAGTFASVGDLENFLKVQSKLSRQQVLLNGNDEVLEASRPSPST